MSQANLPVRYTLWLGLGLTSISLGLFFAVRLGKSYRPPNPSLETLEFLVLSWGFISLGLMSLLKAMVSYHTCGLLPTYTQASASLLTYGASFSKNKSPDLQTYSAISQARETLMLRKL